MPTARELLEQADALMRRNRAAGATAEDLPAAARLLATSPVVPVTTSPALPHTIGPPTHSIGPTTHSFGPSTMAPTLGPMTISPRSIQREPISPSVARTSLPVDPTDSPLIAPAAERNSDVPAEPDGGDIPLLTDAVPDFAEEVPVLTEAIEEIEVDAVGQQALGEPSIWPQPPEVDAERPVQPPQADAERPVQPPEADAETPVQSPESKDPLGLDQPAPGYEPTPETLWAAKRAAAVYDADSIAHALAEDGEPAGEPEEAVGDVAPTVATEGEEAAAAATGAIVLGEAQKREVAEEIRMQVLQRIDIFTDTGLREQLGERLKPLVDKASAELVEAINQHVGELLRAYVAEAIEREIESWRNRQG